jgi:hypothetical protein
VHHVCIDATGSGHNDGMSTRERCELILLIIDERLAQNDAWLDHDDAASAAPDAVASGAVLRRAYRVAS